MGSSTCVGGTIIYCQSKISVRLLELEYPYVKTKIGFSYESKTESGVGSGIFIDDENISASAISIIYRSLIYSLLIHA